MKFVSHFLPNGTHTEVIGLFICKKGGVYASGTSIKFLGIDSLEFVSCRHV